MQRRESPYSRIETIRRTRGELIALVVVTVVLGLLINLLASGLYQALGSNPNFTIDQKVVLVGGPLFTLLLVALIIFLLYRRMESDCVLLEVWLPYYWPEAGTPEIVQRRSYPITGHARRAFAHHFAPRAGHTEDFIRGWRQATTQGQPYQQFIAPVNAQLIQYLLLSVMHRYGDATLGPEANYTWQKSDLPSRHLGMVDLPAPLRDNPFQCADQDPEQWRLWWPKDVKLCLETEGGNPFLRWRLLHKRYGSLEIRAYPQLSVAGPDSQPMRVFLQRFKPQRKSELFVVGTRLEAKADFRWVFLSGSEPFYRWATGLLAYLEEALDWGYFLEMRPGRLITDLDWRIGRIPEGTSLWQKLETIEKQMEKSKITGGSES